VGFKKLEDIFAVDRAMVSLKDIKRRGFKELSEEALRELDEAVLEVVEAQLKAMVASGRSSSDDRLGEAK